MRPHSSAATFHVPNLDMQFQMNFTPDQCNSKWKNLLRAYKKFVDNSKTTGAAALPIPPYYNEIHGLVRDSHSVNTSNTLILDSGAPEVL